MLLKFERKKHIYVVSRDRGLSWYKRHLPGFARSLYVYGDGFRDNDAFNEAIEYLPNNPGGEIKALEGNYSISSTVNLADYVWLCGVGRCSTVLTLASGANTIMLQIPANADYVTISDMFIDGDKTNNGTTGVGIKILAPCERPHLRNLLMRFCQTYAVQVLTGTGGVGGLEMESVHAWGGVGYIAYLDNIHSKSSIRHSSFGNSAANGFLTADGLAILNSKAVDVEDVDAFLGKQGIYFEGCSQINVRGSRADRCIDYGIRFHGVTDSNIVDNSVYGVGQNSGSGVGIGLGGGTIARNLVALNQIIDSSGQSSPFSNDVLATGIHLWDGGATTDTVVKNNPITGATNPFIDTSTGPTTVEGNPGYVTENYGIASNVTLDGSGVGVIAHGCDDTPTIANVQCQSDNLNVRISSIDGTNINILVKDLDGAVVTADTHDFYWEAKVR